MCNGGQRMEWVEIGLELSLKNLSKEKERTQALFYFASFLFKLGNTCNKYLEEIKPANSHHEVQQLSEHEKPHP